MQMPERDLTHVDLFSGIPLVASPSQPDLPGCEPSSSAKSTPGAGTSCGEHGPGCRCGMTCELSGWITPTKEDCKSDGPKSEEAMRSGTALTSQMRMRTQLATTSISSPQASPVSPHPAPVSSEERRMIAGSGLRLCEFLPKSDLLGAFSRILLGSETWGSPEFSLRWKHTVTRCGSTVYQLAPSARRTSGCGIGSWGSGWPTTNVSDGSGGGMRPDRRKGHSQQIADQAHGPVTSGCLARAESFVVRLLVLSSWLMAYSPKYLRHWENAKQLRSLPKSTEVS